MAIVTGPRFLKRGSKIHEWQKFCSKWPCTICTVTSVSMKEFGSSEIFSLVRKTIVALPYALQRKLQIWKCLTPLQKTLLSLPIEMPGKGCNFLWHFLWHDFLMILSVGAERTNKFYGSYCLFFSLLRCFLTSSYRRLVGRFINTFSYF